SVFLVARRARRDCEFALFKSDERSIIRPFRYTVSDQGRFGRGDENLRDQPYDWRTDRGPDPRAQAHGCAGMDRVARRQLGAGSHRDLSRAARWHDARRAELARPHGAPAVAATGRPWL